MDLEPVDLFCEPDDGYEFAPTPGHGARERDGGYTAPVKAQAQAPHGQRRPLGRLDANRPAQVRGKDHGATVGRQPQPQPSRTAPRGGPRSVSAQPAGQGKPLRTAPAAVSPHQPRAARREQQPQHAREPEARRVSRGQRKVGWSSPPPPLAGGDSVGSASTAATEGPLGSGGEGASRASPSPRNDAAATAAAAAAPDAGCIELSPVPDNSPRPVGCPEAAAAASPAGTAAPPPPPQWRSEREHLMRCLGKQLDLARDLHKRVATLEQDVAAADARAMQANDRRTALLADIDRVQHEAADARAVVKSQQAGLDALRQEVHTLRRSLDDSGAALASTTAALEEEQAVRDHLLHSLQQAHAALEKSGRREVATGTAPEEEGATSTSTSTSTQTPSPVPVRPSRAYYLMGDECDPDRDGDAAMAMMHDSDNHTTLAMTASPARPTPTKPAPAHPSTSVAVQTSPADDLAAAALADALAVKDAAERRAACLEEELRAAKEAAAAVGRVVGADGAHSRGHMVDEEDLTMVVSALDISRETVEDDRCDPPAAALGVPPVLSGAHVLRSPATSAPASTPSTASLSVGGGRKAGRQLRRAVCDARRASLENENSAATGISPIAAYAAQIRHLQEVNRALEARVAAAEAAAGASASPVVGSHTPACLLAPTVVPDTTRADGVADDITALRASLADERAQHAAEVRGLREELEAERAEGRALRRWLEGCPVGAVAVSQPREDAGSVSVIAGRGHPATGSTPAPPAAAEAIRSDIRTSHTVIMHQLHEIMTAIDTSSGARGSMLGSTGTHHPASTQQGAQTTTHPRPAGVTYTSPRPGTGGPYADAPSQLSHGETQGSLTPRDLFNSYADGP